jgi:hypothetical protein
MREEMGEWKEMREMLQFKVFLSNFVCWSNVAAPTGGQYGYRPWLLPVTKDPKNLTTFIPLLK